MDTEGTMNNVLHVLRIMTFNIRQMGVFSYFGEIWFKVHKNSTKERLPKSLIWKQLNIFECFDGWKVIF